MRTFIALDLNDAARRELTELQRRLQKDLPNLKWTRPQQLHLTLKFLGDIEEAQANGITTALAELSNRHRPFDITLHSLGCFGPRRNVGVVWAGIVEPTGALTQLHRDCETTLQTLGIAPDDRAFNPHLTIARNREFNRSAHIRQVIERTPPFKAGPFPATTLTLYQSTLGRDGPTYQAISTHTLSPQ